MTQKTLTPSFLSSLVFIRHFGSGRGRTGSRLAPVSEAMHTIYISFQAIDYETKKKSTEIIIHAFDLRQANKIFGCVR